MEEYVAEEETTSAQHPYPIETVAYDEAGHAVMARLFGRIIYRIVLVRNVAGSVNGYTLWNRDSPRRDWDPNIPYSSMNLRTDQDARNAEILIIAAGKAAERLCYRRMGVDEALASYGEHDDRDLEQAIHEAYPDLPATELAAGKQKTDDLAADLLEQAWPAVKAVAQELRRRINLPPRRVHRMEGVTLHRIISQAFVAQHRKQ